MAHHDAVTICQADFIAIDNIYSLDSGQVFVLIVAKHHFLTSILQCRYYDFTMLTAHVAVCSLYLYCCFTGWTLSSDDIQTFFKRIVNTLDLQDGFGCRLRHGFCQPSGPITSYIIPRLSVIIICSFPRCCIKSSCFYRFLLSSEFHLKERLATRTCNNYRFLVVLILNIKYRIAYWTFNSLYLHILLPFDYCHVAIKDSPTLQGAAYDLMPQQLHQAMMSKSSISASLEKSGMSGVTSGFPVVVI